MDVGSRLGVGHGGASDTAQTLKCSQVGGSASQRGMMAVSVTSAGRENSWRNPEEASSPADGGNRTRDN